MKGSIIMKRQVIKLVVLGIALLIANIGVANATPLSSAEHMILQTMMESTTSAFTTLADTGTGSIDPPITWTGTFDETSWSYSATGSFGGEALILNYSGSLSGLHGEEIVVSFDGTGWLGTEPLLIVGKTTWFYDTPADDYIEFDFEQLTKIGANSFWGWVTGAEVTGGVASGIVVGIGGTVIFPPGGWVAGITTGTGATGVLVGISAGIKSLLTDAATAPEKPAAPIRTSIPINEGDSFANYGNIIVVVVEDANSLVASDFSGHYRSSGNFDGAGGSFSGEVVVSSPGYWETVRNNAIVVLDTVAGYKSPSQERDEINKNWDEYYGLCALPAGQLKMDNVCAVADYSQSDVGASSMLLTYSLAGPDEEDIWGIIEKVSYYVTPDISGITEGIPIDPNTIWRDTPVSLDYTAFHDRIRDEWVKIGESNDPNSNYAVPYTLSGFEPMIFAFPTIGGVEITADDPINGQYVAFGSTVASCSYVIDGDIDGDCKVDLIDLALVAKDWLDIKPWPLPLPPVP